MTTSQILKTLGGRLVGTEKMKKLVAQAIQKLPEKNQDYLTHHTWILSSHPDSWAFAFHGDDLKDSHLIFLSDDLLNQHDHQILFTVLHEFGHIILGHKNSIDYKQSMHEIDQQENAADQFAKKYLA
jgi:Zn-dependent protease with chaperone function